MTNYEMLIGALLISKQAYEKAMNRPATTFVCSEYIMKLICDLCTVITDMEEQIYLLFGCRVIEDYRLNSYDGYEWH